MMKLDKKLKVGVLGATGMVGQRFLVLLENHTWFDVVVVLQDRLTKRLSAHAGNLKYRCLKNTKIWLFRICITSKMLPDK